jgi:ABC-type Co2+ transport system permease subunit
MGGFLAIVAAPAFVAAMIALQPTLAPRKAWRWPLAGVGLVVAGSYFVCLSPGMRQSLPDGAHLVLPDLLTSLAFYLLFGAVLWDRIDARDHGSPILTLLKFLVGYFGLAFGCLLVGGALFLGAGTLLFRGTAAYSSNGFNLGFAVVSSIVVIAIGKRLAARWKWPSIGMVYGTLVVVHGMLQGGCVYQSFL